MQARAHRLVTVEGEKKTGAYLKTAILPESTKTRPRVESSGAEFQKDPEMLNEKDGQLETQT